MIDIFFATKQLTISDHTTSGYEVFVDPETTITRSELLTLLDYHSHVTLRCNDIKECYAKLSQQFIEVTAAGGLVFNGDDKYLMIHRNGRYDLPKGHWEVGESIEECAVREVEEETGVKEITLGEKICETIHAYFMMGRWEIKTTHWYAMQSDDKSELTPQTEEGIDRAEWLTMGQITDLIESSFPTIQRVVAQYSSNLTPKSDS